MKITRLNGEMDLSMTALQFHDLAHVPVYCAHGIASSTHLALLLLHFAGLNVTVGNGSLGKFGSRFLPRKANDDRVALLNRLMGISITDQCINHMISMLQY